MQYKFWSPERLILCLKHGDFSSQNRVAKAIESLGKVCDNNTPDREWVKLFLCADFSAQKGEMWLSKVARRGEISNAISKIFVGYCVGCEDL